MVRTTMASILHKTVFRLRRLVDRATLAERSDRELLGQFRDNGDEEAFALLVRRHAGLVLGVCQRVLGNMQDAEDAFQATFLVLARKAGAVAWQENIKNWLHGVAHRVALKARRRNLRRREREAKASQPQSDSIAQAADTWDELRPVLDEELATLPARYRAPLILCYLEGRTRDEVAEELGWSIGSVKGRLERGRELLRKRLLQRGLPLSAVLCAGLLPGSGAAAGPSAVLVEQATQAALQFVGIVTEQVISASALTLAQGVLNAMLISKLKISTLVLFCAGMLGLGANWMLQPASARDEVVPSAAKILFPTVVDEDFVVQREEGGRDGERKKDAVRGSFLRFDAEKGLITLSLGRDEGRNEQTYHLAAKNVPFKSNLGEPIRPASLIKGTQVTLTLNELDDVAGVEAAYPTLAVVLKSVNPARHAISVTHERGERAFKVAPAAKLSLLGKPAKLEEFKEGTRVELTLDFERETVLAIGLVRRDGDGGVRGPRDGEGPPRKGPRDGDAPVRKGPRDGERPGKDAPRDGERPRVPGRPVFDVNGVITSVNVKEGTIDVLGGGEGDPWIKTFTMPKDLKAQVKMARINLELSLSQLSKAQRVSFNLGADKKTIASLVAFNPAFRDTVKAVDAAANKITAGETVYAVDKDATILIQNKPGTLAEVTPGMFASYFLTPDRSRILVIQAFRAERERE